MSNHVCLSVPFFPLTLPFPPTTSGSHLSSRIFISLSLSVVIPAGGLPYTVSDELGGGRYEASTIVNGVDVGRIEYVEF